MRALCAGGRRRAWPPSRRPIWLLALAALQLAAQAHESNSTQPQPNAAGKRHERKLDRTGQARTKLAGRLLHKFAYDNNLLSSLGGAGAQSAGQQRANDRAAKEPQLLGGGAQLARNGPEPELKWRAPPAAQERLLMEDFGRKTSPLLHFHHSTSGPDNNARQSGAANATSVEQRRESNLLYTSQMLELSKPAAVDVRSGMVFVRDTLGQPPAAGQQAIKTLSARVQLATTGDERRPDGADYAVKEAASGERNELFALDAADESDEPTLNELDLEEDLAPPTKVLIHLKGPEQSAGDAQPASTVAPVEAATKRDLGDADDDEEAAAAAARRAAQNTGANQLDELLSVAASSAPIVAEDTRQQQQQRRKQTGGKLAQTLSNRLGQPASGQRQEVRSASSGIRVTLGNGTRPLFVNSRGLITAAKGQQQQQQLRQPQLQFNPGATTSRPYNPAQLFASSQSSLTLEPIDYAHATSRRPSTPSASWRPEVDFSPTNNKHKHGQAGRPSYQPAGLAGGRPSMGGGNSNAFHSQQATTTTKWPSYLEFGSSSSASHLDEPRRNLTAAAMAAHHEPVAARPHSMAGRPGAGGGGGPIASLDEGQQSSTSAHVSEPAPSAAQLNDSTATTIAANFHHNPPYKQTLAPSTSQPPPTATSAPPRRNATTAGAPMPVRANTRRPGNSAPSQHQKRPTALLHTTAPYDSSAILSEPANKLHAPVHTLEPIAAPASQPGNQSGLADKPPARIRVKLHNLLRNKLLVKPAPPPPGANQQLANGGAPLFSSAVANNVAALIAQKLSSLVRPSQALSPSHFLAPAGLQLTPLNSFLLGMRLPAPNATTAASGGGGGLNRFKNRVSPFAAPGVQPASYSPINKRTASVGSLLVSGLLYGLTVLPALMALTGINPLSAADASASESQLNAQSSAPHDSPAGARKTRSSKRPGAPPASSFSNLLASSADQSSANFAYLIPLLSSVATSGDLEGAKQALEFHQPAGGGGGALALGHEAQSSALRSLYAPPPTVLEPFAASDLGGLLEEQNELDWPANLVARPSARPGAQQAALEPFPAASRFAAGEQRQRRPVRDMDSGWTSEQDHFKDSLAGQRRHRDLARANWFEEAQRQQQQQQGFSQNYDHSAPVRSAPQELTSAKETAANSFDDRAAEPGPEFAKQAHPMQALASVTMSRAGDIQLAAGPRQAAPAPPPQADARLRPSQQPGGARPLALQKGAASVATLIQVSPPSFPPASGGDNQAPQSASNLGGSAAPTTNRHQSAAWSVGSSRANQGDAWAAGAALRAPQQPQLIDGNHRPGQGDWAAGDVESPVVFENFLSQQAPPERPAGAFGDDFALLGPYKPSHLGQVGGPSMELDAGADAGPRQRRTIIMRQPSAASSRPPAEEDERALIGRLALLANQGRPPAGHSNTGHSQLRPHAGGLQSAPLPISETGWRAIEPPAGGGGGNLQSPSWTPGRVAELATRSSQLDKAEGARVRQFAEAEAQTTRRPAAEPKSKGKGKRKKKTRKKAAGADVSTTSTSRPNWLDKDDGESELLMAHSMAMGLRVLNEQLNGHHHNHNQ